MCNDFCMCVSDAEQALLVPDMPILSNVQIHKALLFFGSCIVFLTVSVCATHQQWQLAHRFSRNIIIVIYFLYSQQCQSNGQWTTLPTCNITSCPALAAPTNGNISSNVSGVFGATRSFACLAGYTLIGSNTTTCQAGCPSGAWTARPNCSVVLCPALTNPAGGVYALSTVSLATLTCNTGYCGGGNLTCQANNTWTAAPTCSLNSCPALSAPAFGSVSSTSTGLYGDVRNYTCQAGYTLNGTASVTCQAGCPSGAWSAPAPVCQIVSCASLSPASVPFGSYSQLTGVFNTSVAVSCNTGYCISAGGSSLVCQSSGNWTASPNCSLLTCSALSAPVFGSISSTASGVLGNTRNFSCNVGYTLTGASQITCGAACGTSAGGGNWSQPAPTCTIVSCPLLANSTSGTFSSGTVTALTYGSTATLVCKPGYCGGGQYQCQSNGAWNASAPCVATTCPALSAPTFGSIDSTAVGVFPATRVFSCGVGYNMAGNATLTCGTACPTASWSSAPPTCTIVSCPTLGNPSGGTYSTNTGVYNDTVTLTCNSGNGYCGGSDRTCLSNGTWSSVTPCVQSLCPGLAAPQNGNVSSTSPTQPLQTRVFTCNAGYNLVGSSVTTCIPGCPSTWSSSASCTAVTCPLLSNPTGGRYSTLSGSFGSSSNLTCNTGFCLTSSDPDVTVTSCQANGAWSPALGCSVSQCPPLAAPLHGFVSNTAGGVFGDTRVYSCATGYFVNGNVSTSCLAGCPAGQWSDAANPTTCNPVPCPALPANSTGGDFSSQTGAFGSVVTLTCATGYTGGGDVTCQANGAWTAPLPQCSPVSCGVPPVPNNGTVEQPTTAGVFGDARQFTCNTGFLGDGQAVCTANGTWSPATPVCTPVACPFGDLVAPDNGTISASSSTTLPDTFTTTRTYVCDSGFYISSGVAIATCQANGTWSGPAAVCSLITTVTWNFTLRGVTRQAVCASGNVFLAILQDALSSDVYVFDLQGDERGTISCLKLVSFFSPHFNFFLSLSFSLHLSLTVHDCLCLCFCLSVSISLC